VKFFTSLSDTVMGILLITGGILLLFNTFSIGGETLNTIVMLGALGFIALGIYISNAHQKIYRLLAKEKKKIETPPEDKSSH
jgi:hypothetical protein